VHFTGWDLLRLANLCKQQVLNLLVFYD
jgi:hypothetical protein